jgi:hypothetical protein
MPTSAAPVYDEDDRERSGHPMSLAKPAPPGALRPIVRRPGEERRTTVANKTTRGGQRGDSGGTSAAGGTVPDVIGEAEADEFADDVIVASDKEAVARDLDGAVAGAAGGGTGIGDMAGGTGIGTSDAGGDTGDMAGPTGGEGPGTAGGDGC